MNNMSSLVKIQAASYNGVAKVGRVVKACASPLSMVGIAMLIGSTDLLAAGLPTDYSGVVPNNVGTETQDTLTTGAKLTEVLLKWAATALGVAIVIGSVAAIFKSFRDRRNGDNSDFAATMGGGLVMIVIGLGITILAFKYASGLAAAVITIG